MFQSIFNCFKMLFDIIFKTDSSAVVSTFTEQNGDIVPKELDKNYNDKRKSLNKPSLEHRKKISEALKGIIVISLIGKKFKIILLG